MIVVGNRAPIYRGIGTMIGEGQVVVDLVDGVKRESVTRGEYHGLAW